MPRGYETSPELRARAVDEALKGERSVKKIETELGVTMLRKWLEEHYAAHPEDTRRHLILRRNSGDGDEGEDDGGDENAREDMANKKRGKKLRRKGSGNPNGNPMGKHPDELRKAVEADIKKGKQTLTEIAAVHGVHPTTLSIWKRQMEGRPVIPRDPVKYKKALLMLRQGYTSRDIAKALDIANSAVVHWAKDLRDGNLAPAAGPEAAPSTQLVLGETTMVSSSPPSVQPQSYQSPPQSYQPRSSIMPSQQRVGANVDEAMVEANRQLLDERSALRGMVDILGREKEALVRENDALRRQLTQQLGRA